MCIWSPKERGKKEEINYRTKEILEKIMVI